MHTRFKNGNTSSLRSLSLFFPSHPPVLFSLLGFLLFTTVSILGSVLLMTQLRKSDWMRYQLPEYRFSRVMERLNAKYELDRWLPWERASLPVEEEYDLPEKYRQQRQ